MLGIRKGCERETEDFGEHQLGFFRWMYVCAPEGSLPPLPPPVSVLTVRFGEVTPNVVEFEQS
jgi:hypothetical protein